MKKFLPTLPYLPFLPLALFAFSTAIHAVDSSDEEKTISKTQRAKLQGKKSRHLLKEKRKPAIKATTKQSKQPQKTTNKPFDQKRNLPITGRFLFFKARKNKRMLLW